MARPCHIWPGQKKKGNLDEFGPPVRSTGPPVQTGTGPKTEFVQSHGPRTGPKRTGPVLDRKLNTPTGSRHAGNLAGLVVECHVNRDTVRV